MLIIPADRGIDWRRAPVTTLVLVVLCALVFFAWQSGDNRRLQKAAEYYTQQKLLPLEYPIYISYLSQAGHKLQTQEMERLWEQDEREQVMLHLLLDHGFTRDLEKTDRDFWGGDVYGHWYASRQQLNEMLGEISAFRLGLIPAERRPITYVTYQFMHGDTLHLIGNMIVLAVVAVGVEAAIGSFNLLLCYLFCGIMAGLLYTLVNPGSYLPLVGASGAISGVLGMYAALYGMRKIRFFYSAIFYFGYFTAPALVILPVWILWEVANALWGQTSNIAYWAHAGGLITGGLGVLALRDKLLQVEETYLDEAPDDDEQYRKALDDYLKQLAAFNFEAARRKLADLEARYSDRPALLEHRYHLEKLHPRSEAFHQSAQNVLGRTGRDPVLIHLQHDVFRDYCDHDGLSRLSDEQLLKLMLGFSQIEAWDTVRTMAKEAASRQIRHPMLVKVLRVLARAMQAKGERDLGERYQSIASSMEKELNPAQPAG